PGWQVNKSPFAAQTEKGLASPQASESGGALRQPAVPSFFITQNPPTAHVMAQNTPYCVPSGPVWTVQLPAISGLPWPPSVQPLAGKDSAPPQGGSPPGVST